MLKLKFICVLALFLLAACAHLSQPTDTANIAVKAEKSLPFSDKIITGKLDNGLTYYIRPNDQPTEKLELRLNVRSGSLNESDAEQGIAHFVEHMAFNGTEHFPENSLIAFTEKAGLTFGNDSNAYTSFDSTNYQLSIPVGDEALVTESFRILRDWADAITFEPTEIEKEKGVIIEEWRTRGSAGERLSEKMQNLIFADSLYPERMPIGKMDVISGADRALLTGYYDKWYRAGNMSIIVVGAIDPLKAEELIKENFSSMKKATSPAQSPREVPLQEGTRFEVLTDPELTDTTVYVIYFHPDGKSIENYADLKHYLLSTGAAQMFNERVGLKISENTLDLLGISGYPTTMGSNLNMGVFAIATTPERAAEDMRTMLTEIERLKRFGFTADELTGYITNTKAQIERMAEPGFKYPSAAYADIISGYDNEGGHLTEFWQDKELADRVFAETGLADYNNAFNGLLFDNSALVVVQVPEKEKDKLSLNEASFGAIVQEIAAAELAAEGEHETLETLLAEIPVGGEVAEVTAYDELNGIYVRYANGIGLFVKQNPADTDSFVMQAVKAGGLNSMEDGYLLANFAASAVSASGFDNISTRQLNSYMQGRQIGIKPGASEDHFTISGAGYSKDLATLFQLIYLCFTAPTVDNKALTSMLAAARTDAENNAKSKSALFFREVMEKAFNDKYRRDYQTAEDFDNVTADELLALFKQSYGDPGNFIFVFSGDLDTNEVVELGRIYLGGLPAAEKPTTKVDRGLRLKSESGNLEGYGDVDNKSTLLFMFETEPPMIEDIEIYSALAGRILEQRLREKMREEMGGVYSVGSALRYNDTKKIEALMISFTCDPERKGELMEAVLDIMIELADKGASAEELATAKTQDMTAYDAMGESNGFWARYIAGKLTDKEAVLSISAQKDAVNKIELKKFNLVLNNLLTSNIKSFLGSFNPEKAEG